jgi:hypothetical protein
MISIEPEEIRAKASTVTNGVRDGKAENNQG